MFVLDSASSASVSNKYGNKHQQYPLWVISGKQSLKGNQLLVEK